MFYNLRFNLQKVRDSFVGQIEVSGPGRAGAKRISAPTLEEAFAQAKTHRDELLAQIETFNASARPVEVAAPPKAKPAPKPPATRKAKGKAKKAAGRAPRTPREPVRAFAAE